MAIDLEKLTLRELQKESALHCSHKTVQVMVYQNTIKKHTIIVNYGIRLFWKTTSKSTVDCQKIHVRSSKGIVLFSEKLEKNQD